LLVFGGESYEHDISIVTAFQIYKKSRLLNNNLILFYVSRDGRFFVCDEKKVNVLDCVKYEWSRIPHFYTPFYVYKYATGITTAVTIADNILTYGEEYFEKYRKFLSAGGSLAPLDIIRLADVDLETPAPYEKAMSEFEKTLKELEELI
jgi:oligoendopeptidase F